VPLSTEYCQCKRSFFPQILRIFWNLSGLSGSSVGLTEYFYAVKFRNQKLSAAGHNIISLNLPNTSTGNPPRGAVTTWNFLGNQGKNLWIKIEWCWGFFGVLCIYTIIQFSHHEESRLIRIQTSQAAQASVWGTRRLNLINSHITFFRDSTETSTLLCTNLWENVKNFVRTIISYVGIYLSAPLHKSAYCI
jgi:hypothetical protein